MDRLRRQLAETVPTTCFFYGGGTLWRTALAGIVEDPEQVDESLVPSYYSKNDCRLFVRVGDWRLSSTDELQEFALASAPDVPLSAGALKNQTNPLILAPLPDRPTELPVSAGEIRATLEEIIQGYAAARAVAFSGAHPINATFKALTDLVAASAPVRDRPHLRVKYSAGQGNWASVPWLALMDDRETSSTQRGVYCVYLFREDGSGVYLTLNQGVTDPQRTYGGTQGKAWLREKAASMRAQLVGKGQRLALDDQIDLRTDRSLGSAYEASTVAYVLYERGAVPSDELLLQDLEEVLSAYDDVRVEAPASTVDLALLQQQFSAGLDRAGVRFGSRHDVTVVPFLASLLTKPFVILTGLSGSGKTQIALKFGEWLGSERRLLVAVRPDWTGPEALFGYPDILQPPDKGGRQAWNVPEPLEFILRAARNPQDPYVLILDEMNLAHVERYFADFLSGSESREPQVPNLALEDGHWRQNHDEERIAIPRNLFVVGTVNVDETTYMFSPKVLDRANTLEFRVATEDLASLARPKVMEPAGPEILSTIMAVATDDEWQHANASADFEPFAEHLKEMHRTLSASGWEFGHRTYYEALRFAAIFNAMGETDWRQALDIQVLQKILPRLHGSKKRIEPTLVALARYCLALGEGDDLDPLSPPQDKPAELPESFAKLVRMIRIARVNQFVSFTD
jgi:5-methylcytosine-specific restriction protein B